ncbi:PAS domain-containing protein [Roseibium aggregatum]|uniref:PAS domain-containing protein n=1 Tax=Roseibium aggregatum TaxID=187304 RepID=UPI0025AC018D|nr:PAS domain-containing protein [Roseibium aggregatum]WJS06183.1 PAS domain-containing protein [Roseibium aggregatum]
MSTEVNILIRSMRQLVPNPETSAILTAMGVSYWAYDPVAEELCWQRSDPTSVRGYRLAKLSIQRALQYYIQRDRTRFLQVISNAVEHGLSQTTRVTMKTDGGHKSYDLVASRISGKPAFLIIGLMKECAPEAPVNAELPDILQNLSNVFISNSSAVLITDNKGVVHSANRQFLKLFGISNAKQVVGRDARTIPNYIGKKLAGSFAEMLRSRLASKGTLKLPQAVGDPVEVLYDLHPMALDDPNGGIIFAGELAANSVEISANEVLDAVPTPILVADLDSRRIKYANKAGRGELGLSAKQIGTERLSDTLMSANDVRDLTLVLDKVGWDAGRVWQVQSHIGLKRHYRIRTCFIGKQSSRQIVLEFLPVRLEKDKPGNEKAQNFFSRLLDMSFN